MKLKKYYQIIWLSERSNKYLPPILKINKKLHPDFALKHCHYYQGARRADTLQFSVKEQRRVLWRPPIPTVEESDPQAEQSRKERWRFLCPLYKNSDEMNYCKMQSFHAFDDLEFAYRRYNYNAN